MCQGCVSQAHPRCHRVADSRIRTGDPPRSPPELPLLGRALLGQRSCPDVPPPSIQGTTASSGPDPQSPPHPPRQGPSGSLGTPQEWAFGRSNLQSAAWKLLCTDQTHSTEGEELETTPSPQLELADPWEDQDRQRWPTSWSHTPVHKAPSRTWRSS